jgi:Kef-type K+ transport system membrane component KefB
LLFGFPAHIILNRLQQKNVWAYLLAGAVLGLATPFIFMSLFSLFSGATYSIDRALDDAVRTSTMAAVLGLCIAGIAWLIRRPDRDVTKTVSTGSES